MTEIDHEGDNIPQRERAAAIEYVDPDDNASGLSQYWVFGVERGAVTG